MKVVTEIMPILLSGASLPHPHSFHIPTRIVNLAGLSVGGESDPRPLSSIVMIVSGGSGTIELEGQEHSLACGTLLSCSSTLSISLSPQYQLYGVWIEYAALPGQRTDASPLNNGEPLSACTSKACSLAAELLKACGEPEQNKPFALQQLFSELLSELYSKKSEYGQAPAHWLEQVLHYIDSHYNEDLTRVQMAELAGVSPEHFSRAFRKATGQTFNEYMTLLRIRRAQQRLLTGAPNLTAVALEVGYGEGTYLSRKFKQVVGVSPAAYHRKNKRIVSLNFNHTASLRALEIMPELGVYSAWMERLDLVPSQQKLRSEKNRAASLYGSVAAAQPDVIISYALPAESKLLLPVAPVIELPYMRMGWREQFRQIAAIANREPQAEAWLSRFDGLCQTANQKLDALIGARGTAIVWEIGEESAYCYSSSFGHGCQIVYGDLGFYPPGVLLEQGLLHSGYLEASIKDISAYPAEHIFITSLPSTRKGQERFMALQQSPCWGALPAVQGGRVYQLNQPDKFYGFDPLSSLAQLKTIMQAVTSQIHMRQNHIRP
ncbi:AraC family transcriptional regulator [Paenibacillus sp. S150]|uniref:AraC family transcriptional regulator n=1 Tax=Paenibacillus sp. S150 TaxID=2749826 RepID=UPI001C585183|nr:AraC family transcriptional regulator [Paenibacillus sp. S150]MBW4081193.1 AraC family transcriptional regulator [Paenibacillus sp. S150]